MMIALIAALAITQPSAAAPPAPAASVALDPRLASRAQDLVPLVNGGGDYAALLTEEFRASVSEDMFRKLLADIRGQLGQMTGAGNFIPRGAAGAEFTMRFERGTATAKMQLAPDGRIAGLLVSGINSDEYSKLADLAAVAATLDALPGETALLVTDLGQSATPAAALAADRPLALGSAFKLIILAELVRQIEAGKRSWDDKVTLDGREVAGGLFAAKPKGTVVTLRELAEPMIRVSDNSATDILLRLAGRREVEAMQARLGIANPAANRPFLDTLEAFKLKGVDGGALGRRYAALDEAGRRALLDGEVARTPGSAIDENLFAKGVPLQIETIEWFASPNDLARVMDWHRRHFATPAGAEAKRILALNPGIAPEVARRFQYVGYKGGSEPGVINMTLLLQTKSGRWKVLTAGWNNPTAALDEFKFIGLVNRAAELAAAD